MEYVSDMLVNLNTLPPAPPVPEGVLLKRAWAGDSEQILQFIRDNFYPGWLYEAQKALLQSPGTCFIATKNGELIGFACYDASARGFFGPIGVREDLRATDVGTALLFRTLNAMLDAGYGYAVIGWVGDARPFYQKTVHAIDIPDSDPDRSVYKSRIAAKE